MASINEPDSLPPGWKLKSKVINGRKYKYYINLKTDKKFYSKASMLRYIKDGGISTKKLQHINEHSKKTSGKKQMQLVQASYEWLPTGWVVERRIRKTGAKAGEGYKCFIDPSTGSKFFSKPEVLRFLGSKHRIAELSRRKDKETSGHPPSKLVQANDFEWLPSGWVVERRIRKSGDKAGTKYKCYIDPFTGSKFFSKPEVLRYLSSKQSSAGLSGGKDKDPSGHSVNEVISSSRIDGSAKTRTRKHLFAGEGSSTQSIKAAHKAEGQEKSSGKKNRTSFRVQPDPDDASIPKRTTLSPESASGSQEKVKEKDSLGMTKHTPPAVQDVDATDASLTKSEPTSVSPRDISAESSPSVFVGNCNDRKIQTTKRKKDGDPPCTPLRSSKRLAGVGAEVVFLPIPIEHILRAKPSGNRPIRSIPNLGSVPDEKLEKHQDDDRNDLNEGALKATSRRKSSRTKPSPSLESVPKELHENCKDVDTKILNEGVIQAAGRRKSSRSKLIPCSKSSPDGLHEIRQDVDKKTVLAVQGEPSLMGINDLNSQENHCIIDSNKRQDVDEEIVLATRGEPSLIGNNDINLQQNHEVVDRDEKIVIGIQVEQPLNKSDSKLTSQEVQCQRLEQEDSETVIASNGESFHKIDAFPSQEVKHYTLNVDTKTVLAAKGDPVNKIDYLLTKRPILVDLNDLQLEAPPGFSGNTKVGASAITMKQPLDTPTGNSLGSKVESTSTEKLTLEEQSVEQLASTKKQTEQPQSDLCFTAPLWSDPCLDFAYKTLTGAIPFDDNLAIQDYIQHQLRTSEQSPDICAPNFFRNDESKLVSPLPEDINFLNSNGFGSQETRQVKNK